MRIASLLPSATETVCALGRADALVARSEECDFPDDVRRLPVVMRAKATDSGRPSSEIDDRVRSVRGSGESLYTLDLDLLNALRPDLLLTQDLCSVCSVTESEVRRAVASLDSPARVVSLSPMSLEEVWTSIDEVGRAIDRASESAALSRSLRDRVAPGPGTARPRRSRPRVAVVEWLDPPILAGLWTPDMIDLAGGVALGPRAATPAGRTSWTAIRDDRPDLVVLSPCSFSVERTRSELGSATIRSRVEQLRPPLGTWLADEAYFSRPGPRLAHGVVLLRSLLEGSPVAGPMPVERWAPGGTGR